MLEMCAASSSASLAPLTRAWISLPASGGVAGSRRPTITRVGALMRAWVSRRSMLRIASQQPTKPSTCVWRNISRMRAIASRALAEFLGEPALHGRLDRRREALIARILDALVPQRLVRIKAVRVGEDQPV